MTASFQLQRLSGEEGDCLMVTLTYAPELEWERNHISRYMRNVRSWLYRRGIPVRYVWVAELQRRGAVHYHVLLWVPKGLKLPKPDEAGWWPYGMSRIEKVRKGSGYLAKYQSKGTTLAQWYPPNCRLWADGGLDKEGQRHKRYYLAPWWARQRWQLEAGADLRMIGGGWWVDLSTGDAQETPWKVEFAHGQVWLVPKEGEPADGQTWRPCGRGWVDDNLTDVVLG
jgi:hypothetical protein